MPPIPISEFPHKEGFRGARDFDLAVRRHCGFMGSKTTQTAIRVELSDMLRKLNILTLDWPLRPERLFARAFSR